MESMRSFPGDFMSGTTADTLIMVVMAPSSGRSRSHWRAATLRPFVVALLIALTDASRLPPPRPSQPATTQSASISQPATVRLDCVDDVAKLKASSTPEAAMASDDADSKFNWLRHWYPVNVLDTMDPTRPHPIELLGMNLVAWNDGPTILGKKQPGRWRVFEDACPHRLGPLSEGRVESDGNLLCSYHGWRFDGEGACASLPYAPPKVENKLCGNCRARVGAYPVQEADGLLFVFPYGGRDAEEEAAKVALPLIDELHDPRNEGRWKWKIPAGVRDFPCGWDAMVENTLDPAHFCAAHHGTLGNRYEDPAPFEMALTRELSLDGGFQVDGGMGRLEFVPPCLVKYAPDYAGMPFNGSLVIATYCVPTRPGWVRPLANVLLDKEATLGWTLAERALSVFMNIGTPVWLGHILSSVVLHQDAGLLYHQHRNLRDRGYNFAAPQPGSSEPSFASSESYERLAFCPTSVDKGVLSFRQWLRTNGGEGIPWACEDVLPPRGSEDIYDMWHAHTKHCSHCQVALKRLEAARYASLAMLACSVIWMPDGYERTAAVLAAAAAAGGLQFVIGLFLRYEFNHADND